MLKSRLTVLLATIVLPAFALAAAPEGIPRELARERAAVISDVRYKLSFNLVPKAPTTAGHEELTFTLKTVQPLLLDYRDGAVQSVEVNGAVVPAQIDNGHIALPADKLKAGENKVVIAFTSNVAAAGKPIIRFEDKDDGSEYIYTLFVPMDASMAFPCFDQPDIKGRFKLTTMTDGLWTVVSNTNAETITMMGGLSHTVFAETRPISTYLFAFAAGPFKKIERAGWPGVYVRKSKFERGQQEAPDIQETAQKGIEFLSDYFAQPFPFPKYDMVLIPGLAYGGMEHAGATFLREESILFRTVPTHTDILGRKLLVLHELTHQWFGDLTTMRWFDDLWLKEGFAQYMAYTALASIAPDDNVWKRFYESIKPGAYGIDSTKGTTPIYQDIPNLKDAKSAYGAIVYSKAPGVLKQLAYVTGPTQFRDGLRLYLKEHLYANAEWSDLVHALERSSGQKLDRWSEMWIRHRGMPQVEVDLACADGKVTRFQLMQQDALGEGGVWPMKLQIALRYADPTTQPGQLYVEWNAVDKTLDSTVEVKRLVGRPCPLYVFANDGDYAYGRFLLDARSSEYVMQHMSEITDPFRRAMLFGSLWDGVREAKVAPRDYVSVVERDLGNESDESLTQSLLGRSTLALHRYMSAASRQKLAPPLASMAVDKMQKSSDQGLRIVWYRALRGVAETESGRSALKSLLNGTLRVPGVDLRPLDRWNLITTLLAYNDPEANALFEAESKRDRTGDGLKSAYVAEGARPDAATKKKYFDDYLHNPDRPEDWVESSMGAFNYWNQAELTEPYLKPALDALPQIKRERKIFFLVAWLNAFIEGQQSAASDAAVHRFLDTAKPEEDLRLKILQSVDELDRTVKIRQTFPD